MSPFALVMVILVGLLHVLFLILEMFLWRRPIGRRIFNQTVAQANATATLAANQGLYNGFLAVGLFWSIGVSSRPFATFFLICVVIAGIFGGLTAKRSILFIQALPGLIALLAVLYR